MRRQGKIKIETKEKTDKRNKPKGDSDNGVIRHKF